MLLIPDSAVPPSGTGSRAGTAIAGLLLALLVGLVCAPALALAGGVVAVLGERGGYYAEFLEHFRANLADLERVGVVSLAEGGLPAGAAPQLYVAVGSRAQRALLASSGQVPVLSVLVPRHAPESAAGARAPHATIWLDPHPAQLIAALRHAVPGARSLGLLLGPDSGGALAAVRAAGARHGIEVRSESVEREAELIPALNRLLPQVDALLALPDRVAYTRDTVRPVLLTAYRHQKPVLGVSRSAVAAGAMVAVFATPAQIAQHAAGIVRTVLRGQGALPASRSPELVSVAVNPHVARSLGLAVPDEQALGEAVRRAERPD